MKSVFWRNLAQERDLVEHVGENYAFVHVWSEEKKSVLSFFCEGGPDFGVNFKKLLAGASFTGTKAKVVGEKQLVGEAAALLKEAGAEIEKMVEREGRFCLKFSPSDQRILLEKAAPAAVAVVGEKKRFKVMIVDDSVTIRKILESIFSRDPELEVVASVAKPSEAMPAIEKFRPDVITLDIHMPEMNGVELLKKYLPKFPIPTVMVSALSMEDGPYVLNALEAGAVEYIQKPSAGDMEASIPMILAKVKAAASATVKRTSGSILKKVSGGDIDPSKIVAIGSSTGGTEALKEVFLRLPEQIPPIVVVQHIPPVFSKALADRLNSLCPFEVIEAKDGDRLAPNRVIIAPGGMQMRIKSLQTEYAVVVEDTPPVNRHKPSVDVLFDSVAKYVGKKAVGVILTGMGADGAKGLLNMRNAGASTIGQNEASCVVYGMPQAARKIGATEVELPLLDIAGALMDSVKRKKKAS